MEEMIDNFTNRVTACNKALVFVILLLLGLYPCESRAQNPAADTLLWRATSVFVVTDGSTQLNPGKIVTYGTNAVEWTKADNTVMSFEVSSTEGNWYDVTTNGSMVLRFSGNKHGSLVCERNGQGVVVKLVYVEDGVPAMCHFSIGEIIKM